MGTILKYNDYKWMGWDKDVGNEVLTGTTLNWVSFILSRNIVCDGFVSSIG